MPVRDSDRPAPASVDALVERVRDIIDSYAERAVPHAYLEAAAREIIAACTESEVAS